MSKNKTFCILTIILLILLLSLFIVKIDTLLLINVNSDEIIAFFKVSPEDTFSMQWIHSVELEPWTEFFSIDKELNVVLDATKFKAFGAGVPHSAGKKTVVEDGFIIFSEINKTIPYIVYGISYTAMHTFSFNDSTLELYKYVEPDTPVKIFAKRIRLYDFLVDKLKLQLNGSK
ncbi:MAG: hypothetical protein COA82_03250 [Alkaliphilus sp.]|nr:MAG: hypothetical protein COA82_03250 [Alkaliphilus sp.]